MISLFILIMPVLGAILALFFPKSNNAFWLSFSISAAAALLSLAAFFLYSGATGGLSQANTANFFFAVPWVSSLGINFSLGLDGISLLLVLLCNVLVFFIILSTRKHSYERPNIFYALVLAMQAGMLGVFMARDGFLFYMAWEASLIPIYFICSLYGGVNRVKVTLKFFIYTVLGSLFMLAGMIYLYLQTPGRSFSLNSFYALNLDSRSQTWVFIAFYLAFAIKMPIFPLHSWQPDTYTEAPVQGSMLLAGIMLKMGIYGFIRWVLPVVPQAFSDYSLFVIVLCTIGLIYFSVIAFRQEDMKRLLAYSSLAHVALIGAAVFAANGISLQGAIFQLFSHGINITGLFFVVYLIEKQTKTRLTTNLGGIASTAPVLATCFGILVLGNIALPLTNGFVGEFLMLDGIFRVNTVICALCGLTIIFSAIYMLKMYQHVMLGKGVTTAFKDIGGSDRLVLAVLSGIVVLVGVWPSLLLNLTGPAVRALLLQVGHAHLPH